MMPASAATAGAMAGAHDRGPASNGIRKRSHDPRSPMSPLSALHPVTRAVLGLLLRQGRDYAELSELLVLPESGVRARAHAALAALAPDRVAPVGEDGAGADWILGQQDDEEADRTRGAIARMPAWHAWASA